MHIYTSHVFACIQGPTGSGKSSLLNVLAGRTRAFKGAELTGTLLTNGKPRDHEQFKKISAYVLQVNDVLDE